MAAADHEHPAEGHVLSDHQAELGDFGVAEVVAELADEGFVDRAEVGRELFGEANGEVFPGLELSFGFGQVDLGDRLFIESLLRSLRIPGEESGIALVHGGDLDPRDLLHSRWSDALGMGGPEEREEALEEIGQLFRHVPCGGQTTKTYKECNGHAQFHNLRLAKVFAQAVIELFINRQMVGGETFAIFNGNLLGLCQVLGFHRLFKRTDQVFRDTVIQRIRIADSHTATALVVEGNPQAHQLYQTFWQLAAHFQAAAKSGQALGGLDR